MTIMSSVYQSKKLYFGMFNNESFAYLGTYDLIEEKFSFKEIRSMDSNSRLIIQKL